MYLTYTIFLFGVDVFSLLYMQTDDGKIKPTRRGIAMSKAVWERLKEEAVKLRESDEELRTATRCNFGDRFHHNQMSFYDCGECQPFHDPYEIVVEPPPFYSGLLNRSVNIDHGDGTEVALTLADIIDQVVGREEEAAEFATTAVQTETPKAPPPTPDAVAPAKKQTKRSRLETSCK